LNRRKKNWTQRVVPLILAVLFALTFAGYAAASMPSRALNIPNDALRFGRTYVPDLLEQAWRLIKYLLPQIGLSSADIPLPRFWEDAAPFDPRYFDPSLQPADVQSYRQWMTTVYKEKDADKVMVEGMCLGMERLAAEEDKTYAAEDWRSFLEDYYVLEAKTVLKNPLSMIPPLSKATAYSRVYENAQKWSQVSPPVAARYVMACNPAARGR
jgi:hypothetical protein